MSDTDSGSGLYVTETYVNATEGYRFGETDEPVPTDTGEAGEVYRKCAAEYGRCTGKVYVDGHDGNGAPLHVGWVFQKRMRYEDAPHLTYVREVWVTLHDGPRPARPAAPYHVIGARV